MKVYVRGNRFQLFGDRDGESGWEGHCEVCKLEWYTCRVDSLLASVDSVGSVGRAAR